MHRQQPPILFGLGIHGQNLFVDRERGIVVAKVSPQALPIATDGMTLTGRAVAQSMTVLARASGS